MQQESKEAHSPVDRTFFKDSKSFPNKAPGPDVWNVQVLQGPSTASLQVAEVCRRVEMTGKAVLVAKKPHERSIALCHVMHKAWIKLRYYLVEQWLESFAAKIFWNAAVFPLFIRPLVATGWRSPPCG